MNRGSAARTVRQTVVRLGSEVVSKGVHFLFLVYAARKLGTEEFGAFSFAFAWGLLFMIVAEFGVHTLATREMAVASRQAAAQIFADMMAIKGVMGLLGLVICGTVIASGGAGEVDARLLAVALAALYLNTFAEAGYSVFRATGRVHIESTIVLANRLLTLAGGVIAIGLDGGAAGVLWSMVFANGVTMLITFGVIGTRCLPFVRPSWHGARRLWRASLPVGLTSVLTVIYFRLDSVILGLLAGAAAVGLYNAAHRGIEAFLFVPAATMAVLLPVFTRAFHEDRARLARMADGTLRVLLVLVAPAVAGLYAMADPVVRIVFGPEYAGAAPALRVMSWTLLASYTNAVLLHVLIATGRQGAALWASATAAVVNVVCNGFLIPRLGVLGAATATLVTEIVLLLGYYGFLRRLLLDLPVWSALAKAAVVVLVPTVILSVGNGLGWVAVALAAAGFVAAVFLTGCLKRAEAQYLLRAALARGQGWVES